MEYFKISFGSGKALNYVEYGRDKKSLLWRLSDWRRGKGRGARNKSKEIHGHFGVRTLRRGMMWCKWGGSIDPSGWCLQKGRPSAIAISLEGSVEKYKAFIITLLVSFRFIGTHWDPFADGARANKRRLKKQAVQIMTTLEFYLWWPGWWWCGGAGWWWWCWRWWWW